MYKKPKTVCSFMQYSARSGVTKIAKVGIFAVEELKTPTFSPGYLFEINHS